MKTFASLCAVIFLALALSACSRSHPVKPAGVAYYTCTMHPSVRSEIPGDHCPICGMSLVPVMVEASNASSTLTNSGAPARKTQFNIPQERQQLIGVTYGLVEKRDLQTTLRAPGVVTFDPRRRWTYVSRVEGYVEKLEVASTGQFVKKGQPLLTVLSPDLLVAERELVDLGKSLDRAKNSGLAAVIETAQQNIAAARRRLEFWNIDSAEIDRLEQSRQPSEYLTLYSPFGGIIQTLQAGQGRRVMAGETLVDVVDLSAVWVWVEFYQDDVSLLTNGLAVSISLPNDSAFSVQGKIAVIDPFLDPAKRVCRARVDLENPALRLRPEMYVNAELRTDFGSALAVPESAVLPLGSHSLVFVEKGGGNIEPRAVELGRKCGGYYAVRSGLDAGERVATSALFLIDAEAKVQGVLTSW